MYGRFIHAKPLAHCLLPIFIILGTCVSFSSPLSTLTSSEFSPAGATSLLLAEAVFLVAAWYVCKKILLSRSGGKGAPFSPVSQVVFALLWAAGTFAAMEISLRAMIAQQDIRLTYRLHPTLIWTLSGEAMQLNSQGLASPEVPLKKAPGTYRILCLGHSSTVGAGIIEPTYPRVLEKKLNRLLPGKRIEVVNAGVHGYSSFQGLELFRLVGQKFRPDVVTLAFGYHDSFMEPAPDKSFVSNSEILRALQSILYRSRLFLLLRKKILDHIYRSGKMSEQELHRCFRVSPEDFQQNLQEFIDLASGIGSRVFIINMPYAPEVPGKSQNPPQYSEGVLRNLLVYYDIAKAVARNNRIPLVDAYTDLANLPPRVRSLSMMDSVHPNQAGHERIASLLLQTIIEEGLLPRS